MLKDKTHLPLVPDKIYFSIGEAGKLCAVKPHVLRYWEEEFTQLRPVTRSGQRRYYKKEDIQLIRKIRELLYAQGFTIAGAKQYLKKYSADSEDQDPKEVPTEDITKPVKIEQTFSETIIHELIGDLETLLNQI